MDSLERQKRLTKLLAMVQTTRMALAVLRDDTCEDQECNACVDLRDQANVVDDLLMHSSVHLADALSEQAKR